MLLAMNDDGGKQLVEGPSFQQLLPTTPLKVSWF